MNSTEHTSDFKPEKVEVQESPRSAGSLSYPTIESVCGRDNRTKVTNTMVSPYFWVCRLSMRFAQGNFVGSGWLCAASTNKYDVVVTSAHCLYETGTGKFAESVTVVPGANGSEAPYGSYTLDASALRVSDKWKQAGPDKSDYDYGVILIPKTGRLGSCGMWNNPDPVGLNVMNTGYPGDKRPYGYSWEDQGPITEATEHKLFYMNDTFGGQSGSPVLGLKSGTDFGNYQNVWCLGTHGYGGCPNSAVRLTDSVIADIRAWGQS